jgi:hypothetical protein
VSWCWYGHTGQRLRGGHHVQLRTIGSPCAGPDSYPAGKVLVSRSQVREASIVSLVLTRISCSCFVCFIPETTELFSVKFSHRDLHEKLSVEFNPLKSQW